MAYNGLNSAVAGAVSNMAINMIKCLAATISIDFPGHDSYEAVINAITCSDLYRAQGMFRVRLRLINLEQTGTSKIVETAIKVKE